MRWFPNGSTLHEFQENKNRKKIWEKYLTKKKKQFPSTSFLHDCKPYWFYWTGKARNNIRWQIELSFDTKDVRLNSKIPIAMNTVLGLSMVRQIKQLILQSLRILWVFRKFISNFVQKYWKKMNKKTNKKKIWRKNYSQKLSWKQHTERF